MNIKFAELCEKYDLEHWIWVPITFTLPNAAEEAKFMKDQEDFYTKIKRLDAVFVPGGDPGDNKSSDLFPYLEKMSQLLAKTHPKAKIWLSLQHFTNTPSDVDFLYNYLNGKAPTWFGGLVMGPGSPAMELTRRRLPSQYKLRWYPDITHCVRCQYPVAWIDPVLGMTLGREPVNPRPLDYTQIYQWDYTFTDGFLTYSDGVHDDFNKNLWTQLGWNPQISPRTVAKDYARFFFHPSVAEQGADGLFALESDTRGPVAENGSIAATYRLWNEMDRQAPSHGSPWRFHMHLFRADYAYYTRNRLLYELDLEQQALTRLADAGKGGVAPAIKAAREVLERATKQKTEPQLRKKLDEMAETLFKEVGLQTSVPKHSAAGPERGAVMDFVDTPLNNRWWLEDQFDKIEKLSSKDEQLKQIDVIRNWENPGDHGYYDILGNVGRSPRIIKLLLGGDAMRHEEDIPMPTQRWMGEKRNGLRQSWHNYMDYFPAGITYNDLDQNGTYIVKLFAQRESPLVIDDVDAKLISKGETYDQVTEQIFEVPAEASKDGKIVLTWKPLDEKNMNWRQRHYVTDIWVMKKPTK